MQLRGAIESMSSRSWTACFLDEAVSASCRFIIDIHTNPRPPTRFLFLFLKFFLKGVFYVFFRVLFVCLFAFFFSFWEILNNQSLCSSKEHIRRFCQLLSFDTPNNRWKLDFVHPDPSWSFTSFASSCRPDDRRVPKFLVADGRVHPPSVRPPECRGGLCCLLLGSLSLERGFLWWVVWILRVGISFLPGGSFRFPPT